MKEFFPEPFYRNLEQWRSLRKEFAFSNQGNLGKLERTEWAAHLFRLLSQHYKSKP